MLVGVPAGRARSPGLAGLLIAPQAPIGLEDGVLLGLKGMAAALLFRLGSLRLGARRAAWWWARPRA